MNKQLHVKTRKKVLFPHNKVTCKVREEQDIMGIFNIPKAYINLEAIKVMFTASLSGQKAPTKRHCIANYWKNRFLIPLFKTLPYVHVVKLDRLSRNPVLFTIPSHFVKKTSLETFHAENWTCCISLLGFIVSLIGLHLTECFGQYHHCRCDQKLDPAKRLQLFLKHTKHVKYVFKSSTLSQNNKKSHSNCAKMSIKIVLILHKPGNYGLNPSEKCNFPTIPRVFSKQAKTTPC